MNIKFSHKYLKLVSHDGNICEMAKLLDVININIENLSNCFLNYDTANGLFDLPREGDYMMLIFLKDGKLFHDDLFTTLRRRTPEKEKFYRESIGAWFDIEILGE